MQTQLAHSQTPGQACQSMSQLLWPSSLVFLYCSAQVIAIAPLPLQLLCNMLLIAQDILTLPSCSG